MRPRAGARRRAQSDRSRTPIACIAAVAIILVTTAITTLTLSTDPARADEALTPKAKLAVGLAARLPHDEAKRLVRVYREERNKLPPESQPTVESQARALRAAVAPPVCRDAFPPGVLRNMCAQMLAKIKSGGEATAKCALGVVAVVARPAVKTLAMLTKGCGPTAAAVAVAAVSAFLVKHCTAIMPWFLDVSCRLMF
jgi:hypothetical protein